MYQLTETLWFTADRKKVVKDGDKEAAFLLGRKGQKLSDIVAEKLGLTKSASGAVTHRDPVVTNRDLIESRNEGARVEAPKKVLPIVPGPAPAPSAAPPAKHK